MKRQVLQGLVIMLICFLIGGSYIIYAIGEATNQLERAVILHQAHDSIRTLQMGIEKNQRKLMLKTGPPKSDPVLLQTDIAAIKKMIMSCFHCEYSKEALRQLDLLSELKSDYLNRFNQLQTLSPGDEYQELAAAVFKEGAGFSLAVDSFLKSASQEFPSRSRALYRDITRVKHLIIFLVIVGPIAILFLTAYFLKRFTGSVDVLVEASNLLEKGDLDYRIKADLKYEFKHLSDSFNSMCDALKLQRDELQSARTLYQALFESAGEGVFILDLAEEREGMIISANAAAAAMHGYQPEELPGMNITDFSCDDECFERLQCALAGHWLEYIVERKKKNGDHFLAEVNVGLLDLTEKKYALVVSRDITQKKKEEAELQRANQMVLVGEMAAGLAHEIKNPLAGIKVTLEVLADELDLNDEDQDLFVRVINETNRVEKLLKGLLNYARPPQLHYEKFDLNKLLDNSIQNVSITGKNSSAEGIEFVRDFAVHLPQLEADTAQLQQVILNILLNAIEAMPEGGKVYVSTCTRDEQSVEIAIKDSGKGIPEGLLATIFQPFVTTKSKGSGLGLAISKRIIEEHGGTIEVDVPSSAGTRFTIILPCKRHRREVLS
ncbi:ATP-binding protein [uncultured Desulfuromusa sp.]|uniref:sensor histidine kinase n=1 Tax=uncultured Desulfuromusa sp. TaxID=219183 RepID=UPI002AA76FC0|nr:ATP-binding protein [uncultured Desulfuromusa sp.]